MQKRSKPLHYKPVYELFQHTVFPIPRTSIFFYPLNCLLTANVWCTYVNGEWKSFKYAESMPRHNRTNHWVDDFNQRQRRHQPISLEEAFKTKWWPHRQFTFVLSVAETNAVNCVHEHGMSQPSLSLIFVSSWPNK